MYMGCPVSGGLFLLVKMKIAVVGLGLIGGSMAIDLKRKKFADEVIGVEKDKVHAQAALGLGLADREASFEDAVKEADITILAVPVSAAAKLLPKALDIYKDLLDGDRKIIIDVCSVKEPMVRSVHYHPMRKCYVATHPMAGTEYSGPWAALPGLFDGRAGIICNSEDSDVRALKVVEKLYDTLNMRPVYMNSSNHDVHTAYISHASHVISFALANTVLDKEKDEKHIFDLASGGFSSTVRLAKSGADMWVPIFMENRDNLLNVIDSYSDQLRKLRDAIDECDAAKIRELIESANRIKRIIR